MRNLMLITIGAERVKAKDKVCSEAVRKLHCRNSMTKIENLIIQIGGDARKMTWCEEGLPFDCT